MCGTHFGPALQRRTSLRSEQRTANVQCLAAPALSKKSLTFALKGQNVQNAWPQNASRSVLDLHGSKLQLDIFPYFFVSLRFFLGQQIDQRAQVWTGNLQHEFSRFSQCLRSAAVVAIDTEFPGVIQENAWKESEETHYRAMKDW